MIINRSFIITYSDFPDIKAFVRKLFSSVFPIFSDSVHIYLLQEDYQQKASKKDRMELFGTSHCFLYRGIFLLPGPRKTITKEY